MDYLRTIVDWQKINLIAGGLIFLGVLFGGWLGYLFLRWLHHNLQSWRTPYVVLLLALALTLSGCVGLVCFWVPWAWEPQCFPD